MATFTVRADDKVEKALQAFMSNQGHATKSKAVLWLIENADRLSKNDKILSDIVKAENKMIEAKKGLKKVKSPNLNQYLD